MMSEPRLHTFDHAVCDHVIEITRALAAANPKFGRMISPDFPVRADEDVKPHLLLSRWDLLQIEAAAAFALVRDLWVPDIFANERWLDGIPEIRRERGEAYVTEWEDYSAAAFEKLLAGQRFDVGLEVLRDWLEEARRHIRAMGRLDLVPRPSGGHPTWGNCERCDEQSNQGAVTSLQQIASHTSPPESEPEGPARGRIAQGSRDRDFLTPPQLAERLGCRPETVIGWIRSGELPASDLARRGSSRPRYRIRLEDADDFLRRRRPHMNAAATTSVRRHRDDDIQQFV